MLKEYALTVLKNYFTDSIESYQLNNNYNRNNEKTEEKVENTSQPKDNTQEDDSIPW